MAVVSDEAKLTVKCVDAPPPPPPSPPQPPPPTPPPTSDRVTECAECASCAVDNLKQHKLQCPPGTAMTGFMYTPSGCPSEVGSTG